MFLLPLSFLCIMFLYCPSLFHITMGQTCHCAPLGILPIVSCSNKKSIVGCSLHRKFSSEQKHTASYGVVCKQRDDHVQQMLISYSCFLTHKKETCIESDCSPFLRKCFFAHREPSTVDLFLQDTLTSSLQPSLSKSNKIKTWHPKAKIHYSQSKRRVTSIILKYLIIPNHIALIFDK